MRRNLASAESDNVEINLSPMIDMVFILLIFFIVTTVFVEETGVEVNKPEAAAAIQLEKNRQKLLHQKLVLFSTRLRHYILVSHLYATT